MLTATKLLSLKFTFVTIFRIINRGDFTWKWLQKATHYPENSSRNPILTSKIFSRFSLHPIRTFFGITKCANTKERSWRSVQYLFWEIKLKLNFTYIARQEAKKNFRQSAQKQNCVAFLFWPPEKNPSRFYSKLYKEGTF